MLQRSFSSRFVGTHEDDILELTSREANSVRRSDSYYRNRDIKNAISKPAQKGKLSKKAARAEARKAERAVTLLRKEERNLDF